MVYEVKSGQSMSVLKATTVSDKCSDMLYKARCVASLNEGYYLPTMEYYSKQDPPQNLQTDPVNIAWNILRQGGLLCTLLNEYRGNTIEAKKITPMPTDGSLSAEHFSNAKAQYNVKMFVTACRDELFIQSDELFDPADLYTENMNTLNKALAFTEKFYDKLKRVRGVKFKKLIEAMKEEEAAAAGNAEEGENPTENGAADAGASAEPPKPTDKRLRAIEEILTSERAYVSDLDHLFKYFEELKIDKVIPADAIAKIFLNFEELTNFQQRYSYLVESTINRAALKDVQASYQGHIFKKLFIDQEDAFHVYMKYVANLSTARALIKEHMQELLTKAHVMDPQGQLDSFLIKPTQRLCKYPLLIREVIRNSAPDAPDLQELKEAYDAADRNAARVNQLLVQGDNDAEAARMKELVTDWTLNKRQIDKDSLGQLLRYEKLNFMKDSQSSSEVSLYLFQTRLIMCRPGKAMLRNVPTLTLKWGQPVESIQSYQDISKPEEQFYGFFLRYYLTETSVGEVNFAVRNAESVKLWIKALRSVDVPSFDEAPPSDLAVEEQPKRKSFVGRKRASVVAVSNPRTAMENVPGVAVGGFQGFARPKSEAESFQEESVGSASRAPAAEPNVSGGETRPTSLVVTGPPSGPEAAAAAGYVELKFCYVGEFYIVLLPHVPTIDQFKRLAHKTIKNDWDNRGKEYGLTREGMLLKYRDDVGDLINIIDENSMNLAYKYVTPNRITIHILDRSKDNVEA